MVCLISHANLIILLTKSPWCTGLHVDFACDRLRVQIPAEQIFFPLKE